MKIRDEIKKEDDDDPLKDIIVNTGALTANTRDLSKKIQPDLS